jgi:hypothetical protein
MPDALIQGGDTADHPIIEKAIQYILRNKNLKGGWGVNWEDDTLHAP